VNLLARTSRAEALAARLPPLLVEAERVAETVRQGVHGRRRVGVGESFWQFRPYAPGDSRIDWRQSAKSDRVYVRETEWEAAQTVFLWRDATPSMDWTGDAARPRKKLRAELLSLALAALLLKGGERVALPGQPAIGGRGALERLGRALLSDASALPQHPLPRHASLVLIGDFLDPLDTLAATLQAQAARGIAGVVVQLLDPAEVSLPWEGRIRFHGLEGEGDELVPRVDAVREAYQHAFAQQTQALERATRAAGFVLVRHTTDAPPQNALLALHAAMQPSPAKAGGHRTTELDI
jgi:uncharacterized protein (DUF58 family)